jgi:hypothetical protein
VPPFTEDNIEEFLEIALQYHDVKLRSACINYLTSIVTANLPRPLLFSRTTARTGPEADTLGTEPMEVLENICLLAERYECPELKESISAILCNWSNSPYFLGLMIQGISSQSVEKWLDFGIKHDLTFKDEWISHLVDMRSPRNDIEGILEKYCPLCNQLRLSDLNLLSESNVERVKSLFPHVKRLIILEKPTNVTAFTLKGLPELEVVDAILDRPAKEQGVNARWQHPNLKELHLRQLPWGPYEGPLDLSVLAVYCPRLERVSQPDPAAPSDPDKIQTWVKQPDQTWKQTG